MYNLYHYLRSKSNDGGLKMEINIIEMILIVCGTFLLSSFGTYTLMEKK